MVTKLSGNRSQISLKSSLVTDEWANLIRTAAKRDGASFADWIIYKTTEAAHATLKGEVVPMALPVIPSPVDLPALLQERLDRLERELRRRTRGVRAGRRR